MLVTKIEKITKENAMNTSLSSTISAVVGKSLFAEYGVGAIWLVTDVGKIIAYRMNILGNESTIYFNNEQAKFLQAIADGDAIAINKANDILDKLEGGNNE